MTRLGLTALTVLALLGCTRPPDEATIARRVDQSLQVAGSCVPYTEHDYDPDHDYFKCIRQDCLVCIVTVPAADHPAPAPRVRCTEEEAPNCTPMASLVGRDR